MTIKERLDSLRAKLKSRITPESKQEEIDDINAQLSELDEIEKEHNEVVAVSAKYKDTIVNMVLNQGDGKKPNDDPDGSKPVDINESLAKFQEEHKGE